MRYLYTVLVKSTIEYDKTFQAKDIQEVSEKLKISTSTINRILKKHKDCYYCNWISIDREKITPKRIKKKSKENDNSLPEITNN
jgi:predicted transcriptional regulator